MWLLASRTTPISRKSADEYQRDDGNDPALLSRFRVYPYPITVTRFKLLEIENRTRSSRRRAVVLVGVELLQQFCSVFLFLGVLT